MRVLVVYGFEPFGTEPVNPSGEAVRVLDGIEIDGVRVRGVVLPVVYATAFPMLQAVLDGCAPVGVLGVGQGKARFAVETLGRNAIGEKVDNTGVVAAGTIDAEGPAAIPSNTPAEVLLDAVSAVRPGVPCELSDDAGGYLCNHTLYRSLRYANGRYPAGFLHVPTLSVLPQTTITSAVQAAARALIRAIKQDVTRVA